MLFHLPTIWTILLDIAAWFIIHTSVSYFMTRVPVHSFYPNSWLYKERGWEKKGKIYEKLFRLRAWKRKLPDGAALFKNGFKKKHMEKTNKEYFQEFVMETCRAELTHWVVFLFASIFFIWNLWWIGIIMVAYAIMVNMPCIITQRYNRIRLRRVLETSTIT